MIDLSGIFPPIPTAFDTDEELAVDQIKSNIKDLLQHSLAGIVVLGSNGELVMLSEEEKEKVYKSARELIPEDRLMIAGTGGQSTRETLARTRMAADCGADAALVLNPSYYKGQMDTRALVKHYHSIADESGIPLIIYNMPAGSGKDLLADQIIEIAKHPNIIGLKESGGDIVKIATVISETPEDFQVLAGSASFLLPALSVGARGGILALANIAPELCIGIKSAFEDARYGLAQQLQLKALKPNLAVTKRWGVPALKAAMDYLGMYGGTVRKPLLPADESIKPELFRLIDGIK